jgi:hypothetical protein
LGSGLTIFQATDHLVKSGDLFTLSFDYGAYTTNWTATDMIEYYVYTAAGSATPILSGTLATSGTTKLSTGNLTSAAITGTDVGQPLIVEFNYNTVGTFRYGRIDKVTLTVAGGSGLTDFAAWATGNEPFGGDANGDGVKDGIAFLLGAANPAEDASGRLPTATEDGNGNLVLTFDCLPVAARGGSILKVAHSTTLGSWTATTDVVPDADNAVPDNNVTFVVGAGPVGPPALNSVTATISSAAVSGGKLFGRLEGTE